MARGRRGDPPEVQAAKGHPGRRKTKVEKQIEKAKHMAELLASAPSASADGLAPPVFLDERFAPALYVWRDFAPRLHKLNLLDHLHRYTFAMFCVAVGDWIAAREDLAAKGDWFMVRTVSGDVMPRPNPSRDIADRSLKTALELSKRFGLTPYDQANLFKEHAASPLGGLFGDRAQPGAGERGGEAQAAAPQADDVVGMLSRMDAPPPGTRTN